MKKVLLLLCSIFIILSFFCGCKEEKAPIATTGNITFIITEEHTPQPIIGVTIQLSSDEDQTVSFTEKTDNIGRCTFSNVKIGSYHINISKPGYESKSNLVVRINGGDNPDQEFSLMKKTTILIVEPDTLDFGPSLSVIQKTFSLVNPNYDTLSWAIMDIEVPWIVSACDMKGNKSGKIAYNEEVAISVSINRNKLSGGQNETAIIILSDKGRSEITIKAVGEIKETPSVSILPNPIVTSSTATLYGVITNPGIPSYIERGFYYSIANIDTTNVNNNPSVFKKSYPNNDTATYSYTLHGLETNKKYYARAYVINRDKRVFSTDELEFKPIATAPSVDIDEATETDVTNHSIKLNGIVEYEGDPAYLEKGFFYSQSATPTIDGNKIIVEGTDKGIYNITVRGLQLNTTYYYRAYITQKISNDTCNTYYSNEVKSFSLKTTEPVVLINDSTYIDIEKRSVILKGEIANVGIPSYTERGFAYSKSSNPTIRDSSIVVEGIKVGYFSAPVIGMDLNVKYYVRAYVKQLENIYYSKTSEFILQTSKPTVALKTTDKMDVEKRSAVLNGIITSVGNPKYTERGFVYSQTANPTIGDNKIIVEGSDAGSFSSPVTGLELDKTYYVRAYVKQLDVIYYSETSDFCLKSSQAAVMIKEASSLNIESRTAMLNGEITFAGSPEYTERGFVYSQKTSPTIDDNKIIVEGISEGSFSAPMTNLALDKIYYVRAYVKHLDMVYYSKETISLILSTVLPVSQVKEISEKSYYSGQAKVTANISNSGQPAYTRRGIVYGINSNPDIDNDRFLFADGTGTGDFSLYLTSLTTEQLYFVRAFLEQEGNIIYSTNELNFILQPTAATLANTSVSSINNNSAKVTCSITYRGDPIYTEKGFVFNKEGNPEVDENLGRIIIEGNSSGNFEGRLSNLTSNTTYYVKAYVKQNGNIYYSSEQSFKTGKLDPNIITNDATDVLYTSATLNATISYVGDPAYDRRGFYYGEYSWLPPEYSTTILENANSQGDYSAHINGLIEGATYYYRSYVIQPNESMPILGSIKSFTCGHKPDVATDKVLNVTCVGSEESNLNWSARLTGTVSDAGDPAYTSFGFVYGTSNYPTTDDGASTFITTTEYQQNGSTKTYYYDISGLSTNTHYYIRAVATTPIGYIYGQPIEFTPSVVAPLIRTYSTQCEFIDETWAVALVGICTSLGRPTATGLGFVYSLSNNPIVDDGSSISISYTKIEEQNGAYVFAVAASDLQSGKNYYVRAYAKTPLGYTYGEVLSFKTY